MRDDGEGYPECGPSARKLGVRLGVDVPFTGAGMVEPRSGGMSVAPDDPQNIPAHRRPRELGGFGPDPIWKIDDSDLPSTLTYRPDPDVPSRHGFVEPMEPMPMGDYESALASSRGAWTRA